MADRKPEIRNAKIESASITMRDHGCCTFYLSVKGGGWGCNIGGYCIGKGYLGAKEFSATPKGLECLMRIMDTVGVERWEDLAGKYIRIVDNGWGSIISKFGHITDDKWFDFKAFFAEGSTE